MNRNLHISIGTHPSSELSLEQELRLVKAALLYADVTTLYSLTCSSILMVLRAGELGIKHKLNLIEKVVPYLSGGKDTKKTISSLKDYRKKIRIKHPDKRLLSDRKRIEDGFEQHWQGIKHSVLELAKQSHIASLEPAFQSGLLRLHTFEGADSDDAVVDFMADCVIRASGSPLLAAQASDIDNRGNKIITEFVNCISDAVSDRSTYPLFDHQISELVSAGIQAKKIVVSESGVDRAKQVGLAGQLLQSLPLFDQATIDEIIDIRRELDKSLVRFRKAMIEFSDDIKSASWDDDFPYDAESVFHKEVRPAILDIEEAVKSNNLLVSLIKKFADEPLVLPAGSMFSIAISTFASLPQEISASLGIGIPAAAIVFDAYDEWKKKNQTIESNLLYFYYRAQKRLSE